VDVRFQVTKTKKLSIPEKIKSVFADSNIFQRFFNDSVVGQAITFESGELFVNRAFCEMLGYGEAELADMSWRDITHPDDLQYSQAQVDDLTEKKKKQARFVKRYIKKNGEILWAEIHTSPYASDPDHQILLTTAIDITKQVINQEKFIAQSRMYDRFLNAASDFIYLKDENLRHIFLNDSLAGFYHLDKNMVIGRTDHELMDQAAADQCRETDIEAMASNRVVDAIEIIGEAIYESRKFAVPLDNGATGVGAFITDKTAAHVQEMNLHKISETNRIIADCLLMTYDNRQDYLDHVLSEILKLTESGYGYIYLYNEEKAEFILNTWSNGVMDDCLVLDKQTRYQLDRTGFWGEVVRQRKPIVNNDFTAPSELKKGYPVGHVAIERFLSVPVFDNDRIVAVVGVANKSRDYDENDINAVTILMAGIWNMIEKQEKTKVTERLARMLQSMFNNHGSVMILYDQEDGRIIDFNPAAMQFYGYSEMELKAMSMKDITELSGADFALKANRTAEKNQGAYTLSSLPHRLKNGKVRIVDMYVSPIALDNRIALFSIIFDVTDREQAYRDIRYINNHDYLTGLYNRRFFESYFESVNNANNYPIAVIMGDVNGLKLVNDTFGHHMGDELLRRAARLIKNFEGDGNIVARLGGDEFLILMLKTSKSELTTVMKTLDDFNRTEAEATDVSDYPLQIAFGYCLQEHPGESFDVLLKKAEEYVYKNKCYEESSLRSKTINIIMNTLYEKSERERLHSQRVAEIASEIALALKVEKNMVNKIHTAGLFHDIGKIGIDDQILNKVGTLSKSEWEIMKTHAERSYRILMNSYEYSDICDIVRYHHERWDGSGYPQGLKGIQIPLGARIIAVADAFDAMTNERTYQKTRSKEAALEELKRCSNTQFDRKVVQFFENNVYNKIQ